MKTKIALLVSCLLLFAGCAPKMAHRIAPGTELILPFGGSASYSGVAGDISHGEFEGPFGKIKLRGRSLFLLSESGWLHYPDVVRYYKIEWTKAGLLFDGQRIKPKETLKEITE